MGGDTHPLHSSLIPPEKLHKLHVSGPPTAGSATARRGGRQLLDMGKTTYYLTRNCMKTKEFLPGGC